MSDSADLDPILAALRGEGETGERLAAIEQLRSGAAPAGQAAVRALEQLALRDADLAVRAAALEALAVPKIQAIQRRLRTAGQSERRFMQAEINQLEQEKLISMAQVQILRGRYALDGQAPPAAQAAADGVAKPPASLSSILLSETSVSIALYLGAFFVVAAAFILAALIEVARLPILGLTTVAFLGAAAGLARRLPMASFVLFAVGIWMLPIDAGVLANLTELEAPWLDLFWALTLSVTALAWAAGTWLYRSRIFSLFALGCLEAAAFFAGRWLGLENFGRLLLPALAAVAALGAVYLLGLWGGKRSFWPAFAGLQFFEAGLMGLFVLRLLVWLGEEVGGRGDWLMAALLFGVGASFYAVSDWLMERPWLRFSPPAATPDVPGTRLLLPFAAPAAGCFVLAPLTALGALQVDFQLASALVFIWGLMLAVMGEGLHLFVERRQPGFLNYFPYLLAAAALLFVGAAGAELAKDETRLYIFYFLAAALAFGLLSLPGRRWSLWSLALGFGFLGYLTVFSLPALDNLDLFVGYIFLPPPLALLAFDLFGRKLRLAPGWTRPPLILGLLTAGLAAFASCLGGLSVDQLLSAAVALALLAIFLLGYAVLDRRPYVSFFAFAGLAAALGFLLLHLESTRWVAAYSALAIGLDLLGLALSLAAKRGGQPAADQPAGVEQSQVETQVVAENQVAAVQPAAHRLDWAMALQVSGLGLALLVGLAAPLEGGALAAVSVALLATLFGVEAYRRDNVWLGFPTCGLYFIAYAVALWALDVTQPQFYTIVAAALGVGLHYLLARRRQRWAALLTGLLAQMILLSTTYIQMVSADEGQLTFFFILFFQALALLVYGVVIRARSFLVPPIGFLVLGVITAALTVLSGLPSVLIIGCTGVALLLLGILALVMRERVVKAGDRLGGHFENW